ncbi:unnamed protein product [Allacma fusca]|uniref:Cation/H+ exchanger transmembrane domain-containing protein n=1 Tax=Allacma fusca TaxID=39272 RepID=A0A8J2PUR3_9HEXA|nr:unnamed protein product [Allacma fusca]
MDNIRFADEETNSIESVTLQDADLNKFLGISGYTNNLPIFSLANPSINNSSENSAVGTATLNAKTLTQEPTLAGHCGRQNTLPSSTLGNDALRKSACQKSNSQEKLSDFVKQQKWPWFFSSIKSSLGFYPLLLLSIWVLLLAFCGTQQVFPGGNVFSLLLLQVLSTAMGEIIQITRMPPMLGMLFTGIFLANTSFIQITKGFKEIANPIRAISVGILITRGALCVNTKAIHEFRRVVPPLAVIPCVVEAIVVSFAAYWLLRSLLTPAWCALLGCILCSMSGVILMPLLASLDKSCSGAQSRKVIAITRASCGLDAILSICLTNIALGLVYPSKETFSDDLFFGILDVVLGFVFGLFWGSCIGILIDPNVSQNQTVVSLVCGSVLSMIGCAKVKRPRCGAPAVFAGTLVSAFLWSRNTDGDEHKKLLHNSVDKLWWFCQPFLFGILGAKTELETVDWDVIVRGIVCILFGITARVLAALTISRCLRLNWRQQLFIAISWIPKGTVQAAVGPLALDMAQDFLDQRRGVNVLNITIATILIGATVGSVALLVLGKPFLRRC